MTPNPPSLLVPISLAALCVGDDDYHMPGCYGTGDFAAVSADFSALPYVDANGNPVVEVANLASNALPQPFQPVASGLPVGIHLHWALPAALARGRQGKEAKLEFPSAPNRWLVVRCLTARPDGAAPTTRLDAWVVESDQLWDPAADGDGLPHNAVARAVPIEPAPLARPNKAWDTLGRVWALGEWPGETSARRSPQLTAVGYGRPDYAAAYPHCPCVYGFYDPCDDIDLTAYPPATTSVAYQVVGWYSAPKSDPVASFPYPKGADTEAKKLAAVASAFRWTLPESSALPASLMCTGLLYGITWDPATKYLPRDPPGPLTAKVAIGSTTAEAVAALVAADNDDVPGLERLLNLFQLGLLSRQDEADFAVRAEDAEHAACFRSRSAGTVWGVKRRAPGGDRRPVTIGDEELAVAARAGTDSLPEAGAQPLAALNAAQRALDARQAELRACRAGLFADWTRYMQLEWPVGVDPPTRLLDADDAFAFVNGHVMADVALAESAVANAKQTVEKAHDDLVKALGGIASEYRPVPTHASRYWRPNDVVVLLSGEGLRASERYGPRDDKLACRAAGSELTAMTLAVAGGPMTIAAGELPSLPVGPGKLPDAVAAVLAEAQLLDPGAARLLASLAVKAGATAPAADLAAAIEAAQRAVAEAKPVQGSVTFTGTPPAPAGVEPWSPPWIPLILEWELSFTPVEAVGEAAHPPAGYPDDAISTNWPLDPEGIELVPTPSAPHGPVQSYIGTTVLAAGTEVNLRAEIARYLEHNPADPNADTLRAMEKTLDIAAMAQALGGLHEELLMLRQTLQLAVNDPLADSQLSYARSQFSNVTVPEKVKRENRLASVPEAAFNPLRGGTFRLTGLRVIDAFGQVRPIAPARAPAVAAGLQPPAGKPDESGELVPRIAQGARLLLRLRSADDDTVESNSYPSSTPVCGWLAFNHLDDSLVVYAGDGTALGSLLVPDGPPSAAPSWVPAPGSPPAITNTHMGAMVDGILTHPKGAAYLSALLAAIDLSMAAIDPLSFERNPGLAVLMSQPLAVVRATLRLELQGRPALDQSWEAFAQSAQSPTDPRPCAGVTGVRFPVRLGDPAKLGDGLVGYFVDDHSAKAYETFYAPAVKDGGDGVVAPDLGPTSLTPVASANTADPLALTLVMDPRGSIHALTGILPVKEMRIPPALYSAALKRIATTFLTAPVLATAHGPELPLPPEPGYQWTWIVRQGAGGPWQVEPKVSGPQTSAGFVPGHRIVEGWLRLSRADDDNEKGRT